MSSASTSPNRTDLERMALDAFRAGDEQTVAGIAQMMGLNPNTLWNSCEQFAEQQQSEAPSPPPIWGPFPVKALPEALRHYVDAASRALNVDASMIAVPLLPMLAACIGTTRSVRIKRSWSEPCIVWAGIVGESGTKKTPALQAVHAPLQRIQRRRFDEHQRALELYEHELAEYEAALKQAKKYGGALPERPAIPVGTRHIISDTTTEAAAPILQQNERGVELLRDELAGWMGDLDRYSNTRGGDAPRWLSIWSADPITIDRKTTGTTYIHRPAVSITGGIQPGILRRTLGTEHREDGMAARFLLAMPPDAPDTWSDDDIPEAVERELERIVGALLELQHNHDDDDHACPVEVCLDDAARQRYAAWHDEHADRMRDHTGDVRAAMAKMRGYVLRVALVLHMSRWAAGEDVGEQIEQGDIESAIAIIEFHIREAQRIYLMLDESDEDRERRELVRWIERRGGEVSLADMTRSGPRRFRGDRNAAEAELNALVETGMAEWFYPAGSGRPSKRCRLMSNGYGNETGPTNGVGGGFDSISSNGKGSGQG